MAERQLESSAVVRARVRVPPFAGLGRPRLADPLLSLAPGALAVVVAPAGSGKTTLLSDVARSATDPVAWLTLDAAAAEPQALLDHLAAALAQVAPITGGWTSVEGALTELDHLDGQVLIVLDDVHAVAGQPAEGVLVALAAGLPPTARLVMATRSDAPVDVSRRRLSATVLEIGADDLRFRTWEVDGLFREHFGVRLGTDEVPRLTRLTEGWAAGLQLFHLATEGRPRFERNRLLHKLGLGTRFAREYLTSTVLDTVSPGVRRFLVRTAVFDELTPHRCDLLLGADGSGEHLAELARRGLFTFVAEDRVTYRYHDVLRSYLLDTLVGEAGEAGARALHRRAGEILEQTGAVPDAVRSYSRAQDWDAVRRLLGDQGAVLASDPGVWIDALPAAIRDTDPWVLLAVARRLVTEGTLDRARQAYRQASERLKASGGHRLAQAEQRLLDDWLRPDARPATSWVRVARRALLGALDAPPRGGDGPLGELVGALAQLLGGDVGAALARFDVLAERDDLSEAVEVGALLGGAVAALLAGEDDAVDRADAAVAAADLLGYPVLCRVARATAHGAGGKVDPPLEHLRAECDLAEDRWGAAVVGLVGGLGALGRRAPAAATLLDAGARFAELGAPVVQDWCTAAGAAAAQAEGLALDDVARAAADKAGRRVGLLPHALALLVAGGGGAPGRARAGSRALAERAGALAYWQAVAAEPVPDAQADADDAFAAVVDGFDVDLGTPAASAAHPPGAALEVRCLGGFEVRVGGTPLDLGSVKPRQLQLLELLALHGGRVVHRELLVERLWPALEPAKGAHSLQVAVSAVRRLAGDACPLVARERDGYRLALGPDDHCDVRLVEDHLERARRALRQGDAVGAERAYERVIDLSAGDLLPEVGPEEWVLEARDRLRLAFGEACQHVADALATQGRHAEAARVAQQGLERVPSLDGLWRRAIAALEATGDHAAAQRVRSAYDDLLDELGLTDRAGAPR